MKKIFTNILLLSLILLINMSYAQHGLDSVIVEKYYISNISDSIGSNGILPVKSVTYRIYVSMHQGYKFQMAYGNANHPLSITTSTAFFNNEDRGSTTPVFTKAQAKFNTVMLDSWLSVGAACVGNFGILKSKDNGVATIVNADNILQNADTVAGIPLTIQDGLIAGSPGTFATIGVGIDTAIAVFDATSQFGNSFEITNAAWFCMNGATGPDTNNNQVLIAQITTNGRLKFKLNIQLGTPTGGIEKYVAQNPMDTTEIQKDYLTYASDSNIIVNTSNYTKKENNISVYPNPSNGIYNLNVFSEGMNSENYFTIYSILGNVILKKKMNDFSGLISENIDLTSFPKGIYFIEINLNGVSSTKKIIKN
ncbi:MAG: T9SS type A sorting domain-containing protein [Bacteroidetes bacterium]|nr:T9SS type A sorting domain-containing protein [Bacteroidota bacterium]